MSNVLEQAQEALCQKNWSLLTQCLQQLLSAPAASSASSAPPPTTESLVPLLDLAIAVLEAGDFQDRWDIAKLLPAFGERAIAPLIDLLQDDEADSEARWFAARILGSYSQPSVVITLAKLLQTSVSEEIRSICAEALAQMGSPAIAVLTDLLAQDDTRVSAVRSLAHIRRSETIDPLLTVVDDPDSTVRAIAIEALGSFHDPRVPPVLLEALHDMNATVRQVAVEGLGVRNDLVLPLDLVRRLSERLRDPDSAVCRQAAIALGRFGSDDAAAALFAVLISPQTSISLQIELVWALGWIGTAIALEYLQQALLLFKQPASRQLYQAIITAIGRWEAVEAKPQAAQVLIDLLATNTVVDQPVLKQAIVVGIGALGQTKALEALVQLLADQEMSVRLHAIAALKALDATAAHQRLEVLASRTDVPEALKQGAAIALREW